MSSSPTTAVLSEIANQFTDPRRDPTEPRTCDGVNAPVVTDSDRQLLLEALAQVPVLPHARGVRHRLAPLLAAFVCAAVASRNITASVPSRARCRLSVWIVLTASIGHHLLTPRLTLAHPGGCVERRWSLPEAQGPFTSRSRQDNVPQHTHLLRGSALS